jgi:ABC-type Fe3+-siderophore transport system permease subunit
MKNLLIAVMMAALAGAIMLTLNLAFTTMTARQGIDPMVAFLTALVLIPVFLIQIRRGPSQKC